ncbi:MAG: glycosyltransferase [Actinomycetes bacterium]|jgi:glycosyltransferase involved in cell wall biosynthesis|nr:glycosyltransferase [Actinomycetes bacterium]
MNIRPLIIIPTYWTRGESTRARSDARRPAGAGGVEAPYAHPSALTDEHPPLIACLKSLRQVSGLGRIALIVACDEEAIEVRADEKVRGIVEQFPELNIFVFGSAEAGSLYRRLEQLELGALIPTLQLKSYGAARNLGLAVASILGSDAVVFIDDDEVVDAPDFLEKAVFGIGHPIHSGGYLFAKSGLVRDMRGAYYNDDVGPWTDVLWRHRADFNRAVQIALRPPQMHRGQFAYGGCMVIHREMYTKIAFDPWIMRGEDVDYVINARLHGADIYLDDQWTIRHDTHERSRHAIRFRQNVFRFIYEHRKLEFAKSQVDLAQVTPQQLMPFPGAWIATSVAIRAFITGLLHVLTGPDRGWYWQTALDATGRAGAYARENCVNYFALQRAWRFSMEKLWRDVALNPLFTGERTVDRSALTGSFSAIGDI